MQDNPISPMPKPKSNRWMRYFWAVLPTFTLIFLIGIIVVLFGLIRTKADANKEEKAKALRQEESQTNVVAMEVRPGLIRNRLNLPGVVRPWIELNAVAEVNGIIAEKVVVKGAHVKKGDYLAIIDERDYQNSYLSAQAAHGAAKASFERLNTLLRNNAAAQAQVDEARANLETTRAAMANAQLRLERTVIRSPISGVVDETFIENGQYVIPGDQVARILHIDRVKVQVGIPESDVDAVRRVKKFKVTIDALNSRVFDGEFSFLSKSAQSTARLYTLEVAVDNPRGEILSDMFTRVDIVKQEVADGLAVPLYSLIKRQDGRNAVYLADNGKARLQEVRTGILEGWRVQITTGLKAGDKVIVIGHRELKDGVPLNVIRTVNDLEELNQ